MKRSEWLPMHPLPPVFPFRWAIAHGEDRHGLWQAFEVNAVRQVMRWIPPGRFVMGSPPGEPGRRPEERARSVRVDAGFWLADTVCTLALWVETLGITPYAGLDDRHFPVVRVGWIDVTTRFLPALRSRLGGFAATLPTEAQWEYACRAGTSTPFWFGEQVDPSQVNFAGAEPLPVKALPPNGWGLYQMHGNVMEWCADALTETASGPSPGFRVVRGGSFEAPAEMCRSASRKFFEASDMLPFIGLRFAHPAVPP